MKQFLVEEEVQKIRYDICQKCPELRKSTKQCKICHCFMPVKTRVLNAECPLGKWNSAVISF